MYVRVCVCVCVCGGGGVVRVYCIYLGLVDYVWKGNDQINRIYICLSVVNITGCLDVIDMLRNSLL